jgi:hypothetical protein
MATQNRRDSDNDLDNEARDSLLLDKLGENFDAFQLLRKDPESSAEDVLGQLGVNTELDRQIVLELSSKRPLGHTDRFPEAHSLAVRSLEVLDRNGSRKIPLPRLGPLTPVANYLVSIVTQFIVRNYLSSAIDSMRRLYQRREANCLLNDPARPMLTRARIHAERLTPGFKRNPLGIPAFLFGGAFISSIFSALADSVLGIGDAAQWVQIMVGVITFALLGIASWVLLRGAAVARHRIKLSTEEPLKALWQTVGRAGGPPQDSSMAFAVISIVLLAAGLLVIPIFLGFSFLNTSSGDDPGQCVPGGESVELTVDGDTTIDLNVGAADSAFITREGDSEVRVAATECEVPAPVDN